VTVVRIGADGTPERLVTDLPLPYGIGFDADGNFYVETFASAIPGFDPAGMVLRCDPDALDGPAAAEEEAATPDEAATDEATVAIEVSMVDLAFETSEITIAADTDASIVLTNEGAAPHNFCIDDLDIHSETLRAGDNDNLTVNLPAGTYTFYCDIPGHRQAGMVGTLTVE